MTDNLTPQEKTALFASLKVLVHEFSMAGPLFKKDLGMTAPHDKFIRALIHTLTGYVATSAAIVGAIIVGMSRTAPGNLMQAIAGDLLYYVAFVILASALMILILQGLRLLLGAATKVSPLVCSVLGAAAVVWPTVMFLKAVEVGACGGTALQVAQRTIDTEIENAGDDKTKFGPVLDRALDEGTSWFTCSGFSADWFTKSSPSDAELIESLRKNQEMFGKIEEFLDSLQ